VHEASRARSEEDRACSVTLATNAGQRIDGVQLDQFVTDVDGLATGERDVVGPELNNNDLPRPRQRGLHVGTPARTVRRQSRAYLCRLHYLRFCFAFASFVAFTASPRK